MHRHFVIENMALTAAIEYLSSSLDLRYRQRDSSWYSDYYYLFDVGPDREMRVSLNEDFEGEALEDGASMSAVLITFSYSAEDDELVQRLTELAHVSLLG
jgi:hypothetical protein